MDGVPPPALPSAQILKVWHPQGWRYDAPGCLFIPPVLCYGSRAGMALYMTTGRLTPGLAIIQDAPVAVETGNA